MTTTNTWKTEFTKDTTASVEALWRLFANTAGWKEWNAGIERLELEGPFATGTWFTMQPPGQDPMRSRFTLVKEHECFVDETRVDELVITVTHRLERVGSGARVRYQVDAAGPGAGEVGPMVSSDFPDVLAALVALAEKGPRS